MSENDVYSMLASSKKCPVCSGELETVYFSSYRSILGVRPFLFKNLPTLRCESCRIAIFSYEKTGIKFGRFLKKCVKCGEEIPIASEACPSCGAEQPEYEEP